MASFNRVLGTMAFSPNSKIEASLHHFTTGDCFLAGIHCYLPFASLLFDWTGPADIVPKRSGDCEGSPDNRISVGGNRTEHVRQHRPMGIVKASAELGRNRSCVAM